jgi:hypothetical protein
MHGTRGFMLIKLSIVLVIIGLLVILLYGPVWAQAPSANKNLEVGIARSNLIWESKQEQATVFAGIHSLQVQWFRDGFAYPPNRTDDFVDVVRQAKQANLKMLVNIAQSPSDYDGAAAEADNGGEVFRKLCGWPQGSLKLSQINLNKFKTRLGGLLEALKVAHLEVDAFEIGNEDDWVCFNGDVPFGRDPTQDDVLTATRGYARFLQAAAETIRDPRYFPKSEIIIFGMAHIDDVWDPSPRHHLPNPAAFVASLRNLDGFNYLSNDRYRIDGIGSHIYTDPDDVKQSVTKILDTDASALGFGLPIWITEFGWRKSQFPTKTGKSRADAITEFFAALANDHRNSFGPVFYYSYNGSDTALVDKTGAILPEAWVLTRKGQ